MNVRDIRVNTAKEHPSWRFPFVFRRARVELGLCESASSGPKVALDYRCLKDASDLAMEKLQDRLADFSLCTKKAD